MHTTPASDITPRELCHRSGDGLEVTLWWLPGRDGLQVSVVDTKLNQSFQVSVDSARAMRAFNHPYLYVPEHTVHLAATDAAAHTSPSWTATA